MITILNKVSSTSLLSQPWNVVKRGRRNITNSVIRRGPTANGTATTTATTTSYVRRKSFGNTSNPTASASSNHHHHPPLIHHTSSSTTKKPYLLFRIQTIAFFLIVLLAILWIITIIITILYHIYYGRPLPGLQQQQISTTTTNNDNNYFILKNIEVNNNNILAQRNKPISDVNTYDNNNDNHNDYNNDIVKPYETPIVIFTCHRAEYLQQTLDDIAKYIPYDSTATTNNTTTTITNNNNNNNNCFIGCPIIISQDGTNKDVTAVIEKFIQTMQQSKPTIPIVHIQHKTTLRKGNAYENLAIHYGWALKQIFDDKTIIYNTIPNMNNNKNSNFIRPQRVIILEEDLHIAPDFFTYFHAMIPIIEKDKTILAISAFNDNGFYNTVSNAKRVLRSDFFPGLGWMMTKKLWLNELQYKWPNAYWDDWLREPNQRQDRHILRPEISRTYHFGIKGGASSNQFGTQLSTIALNPINVNWTNQDLSYLYIETYNQQYYQLIKNAALVSTINEAIEYAQQQSLQTKTTNTTKSNTNNNVRIEYTSFIEFQSYVHELDPPLMDDEKATIPRTAYYGIVETRLLFPKKNSNNNNDHDNNSTTNTTNDGILLFLTPPLQEVAEKMLQSSLSSFSDNNDNGNSKKNDRNSVIVPKATTR